ncbi:5'-methylthioadenosine/adenosylhomocysteine nucleosidase [Legionella sp. CNM-4043-24]|uniref:5'-methylthioadenosine/adenosylhomocysteine nucleosidase n=1 Tax=Legionella sp. CNM-4043-24 TaxID=3421646 RepID=UPI00403AEC0C
MITGVHIIPLKYFLMEMMMKTGILGAMLEEIVLIKELMEITHEVEIAGRVYYEGSICGNDVVLTFSRWGKVASASTVTTLINKFEIDSILFMGVAGAVSQDLNIGDVVVASGLYQHDMDARPIFDQFQIPLTTTILFKPAEQDICRAKAAAEIFLQKISDKVPDGLLIKYAISDPKVHTGLIASGDQFVSDPIRHVNLSMNVNNQKTLAVEMEGAAIAQICSEYDLPFIVIRTISDKADHSAVLDFQSFIRDVASHYSVGIVQSFFS